MTTFDEHEQHQIADQLETIQDTIRWCVSYFNQAGIYYGHGTDNPWDEALMLVTQLLHLPRHNPPEFVSCRLLQEEKRTIVAAAYRRVQERVPVAYLTNQAWFCELPFYVDERVLVPRSPFAELISHHFGAPEQQHDHILDLCTGSGCIAIALAQAYPTAIVDAVDISTDALEVADINICDYGLTDRVYPICSDLFSALKGQKYDLIVSNPPYVDAEDMADLPDEFHHEPELGLAAGHDGLDLVHTMLRQAKDYLTETGVMYVEVGNSLVHMDEQYPTLEFEWVELQGGGDGIFKVTYRQLCDYFSA